MTSPEIRVAMTAGGSGFVVAVMPENPANRWAAREVLLVGQVRQGGGFCEPDRPEDFTAWLWPAPGWYPARGTHTSAVKAADVKTLTARLQRRAGKDGPWWAGRTARGGPAGRPRRQARCRRWGRSWPVSCETWRTGCSARSRARKARRAHEDA